MSLALLQSALLIPAEKLLNTLLSMDSLGAERLAELEGRTLAIHCEQPTLKLYISFRNQRIVLSPLFEGTITASLQGSASSFIKILLEKAPVSSLAPFQIELKGSTAFVQQVQSVLNDVDIDWEFHLSRLIGDLPVAAASQGMQHSTQFAVDSAAKVRSNVKEYLLHESELLPSSEAAEQFYTAITAINVRVDRLQVRLAQLQNT